MIKTVPSRPYPTNLPGLPIATLAKLNGVSQRHARRLRAYADPEQSRALLAYMTPDMALTIHAARSPRGHISHWARIAMAHFRREGLTNGEIAELFNVSLRSVGRVLAKQRRGWRGFHPLSGERVLSSSQARLVIKRDADQSLHCDD